MFQENFIAILKKEVPDHLSLSDELSELLSISKDSAYRRLRNETPFTLDETAKVCQKFNIDITKVIQVSPNSVNFQYNKLYDEKDSFMNYLKGVTQVITRLNVPGAKIIYAAEDVPMYYHFEFDNLAAFKIFYWSKAVLNSTQYQNKKFNPNLIHPDIIAAGKQFIGAYNVCDSIEIWTKESVNSTLRQIEYFAESGQFESREIAMLVLGDFQEMANKLQAKAEMSNKLLEEGGQKNFVMYNSEVLIGNNCILVDYPNQQFVFLSHNTFNSLNTTNDEFCKETKKWMDNLIKKSSLISDIGEKDRYQFFRHVNAAIESTRKRLDTLEYF